VSRIPRLLPLVGIAIGGVLAVKVVTEAPQIWGATQAFAEDVVHPGQSKSALPQDASILGEAATPSAASAAGAPAAICAPTAAELAKEAGLSPAELQVLQSLSNRRGELDQREMSLDTQVQLIASAEAKLDSRIQDMNELKGEIQGLLGQADQQQQADQQRLVRVYEDMDPKKAAAAMTVMSDAVRVPIAAAMKERKLAAILQAMQPADAKTLTELLAQRMAGSPVIANAKAALNGQPAQPAAQTATQPAAPPDQSAQTAPTAASDKAGKIGKTAKNDKTAKGDQDQASDQSASADDNAVAKSRPTAKTRRVAHAKARPKQAPTDATASQAQAKAGKTAPTSQAAQPASVASNATKLQPPPAAKGQPAAAAGKTQGAPAKVAPPVPPNANIG
jgi:flagellar motility protein MotE (MotC chaperone)